MKSILITTTLLLLSTLAFVPSASAGPQSCDLIISVDEVQECSNLVIDDAQHRGGALVETACRLVFGPENC